MDTHSDLPGLGSSLAVTFLSLGLVCLLAFVFLRWLARRGIMPQASGPIRVIARCPLEPRRSLFVVVAAGRCFLLGAGDSTMTMLAELDAAAVKSLCAPAPGSSSPFAQVLARVLGRGATAVHPTTPAEPEPSSARGERG
jgi:flagellar biosynthetic protein FliO